MSQTASTFRLSQAMEILRNTPAVLSSLFELSEPWVDYREGENWSSRDVLAHLIHGERTDWIPRAKIILERGEAEPFPPFDREAHLQVERPVDQLLEEFASARAESLSALEHMELNEEDLERRGTHPALGTVSLRQLLATWTAHDLNHIDQIVRTMASRYRGEVGPWNHPDYLGILHRKK